MNRLPHSTNLTDAEWELIQPIIPPSKTGGRPRTVDIREVINAILYIQSNNYAWRDLHQDFPPWSTVYDYFRTWRRSGVWEKIHQALQAKNRIRESESSKW
jgi:putative transposase